MDARWMPILAAAIGVLGGVGGAIVGGLAANAGQEKGFERERAAAIADLRIEEYGTFLGSAEDVALNLLANSPEVDVKEAFERLLVAKARVFLVETESAGVGEAAFAASETLGRALEAGNEGNEDEKTRLLEETYPDEIDHFLDVARDDIERTQE